MLVEQAKSWLLGNVNADTYEALAWAYWNVISPVISEPGLHWVLFALAAAVGIAFYYARVKRMGEYGGPLSYLVPRKIYSHPSSLLDFKYFVMLQIVVTHLRLGTFIVAFVAMLHLGDVMTAGMNAILGEGPGWHSPSGPAIVGITLALLLVTDCARFIAHYMLHKIPVLWEFHKVHHAAEVLNPITGFRVHPLELMLDFGCRLVLTGIVAGVFAWFYSSGVAEATIIGFNAIAIFIYFPIGKLQHSHIALGYGPKWSRVLVSPLMHQVHHSAERQHWDRNMGFIFPYWDWLAGTLYVPKADEQFRLGLPGGGGNERLDSVWRLFTQPFVAVVRKFVLGRAAQA
jgi:sterol desaturase/sphingolipid hydroxylase (fatty acid hydroxylase superfamily)